MITPHYTDNQVTLYIGDALEVIGQLPDSSVDCIVTSPPYWGLRDCGTATWKGGDPERGHVPQPTSKITRTRRRRRCGARHDDAQQGLEPAPQEYVDSLRRVFAEVRRVLTPTGTVWLHLGDSYSADPPGRTDDGMRASTLSGCAAAQRTRTLGRKNLIGMPWRVAFALQQDGWILRNAIVWHKPNAMPESMRDRVLNQYEMIFLLAKQQRYFFALEPIREPPRRRVDTEPQSTASHRRGRNPGDVWTIPTRPPREAPFAAFPIDIPRRCIAAGCPEGGVVLDPFSGAATTGFAARQLGRRYIGIDCCPAFHDIGIRRLGLSAAPEGEAA